jgi:hypothetical protein
MKDPEQLQQVRLNDIPEVMIELSWETIQSWVFVVFHSENYLFLTSSYVYGTLRWAFSTLETWGMSSVGDTFIERLPSSGSQTDFDSILLCMILVGRVLQSYLHLE